MLVIGETVAVGIFLTPAGMAKSLGSPFWLLVVWLVMGGMALTGALVYGELGARFRDRGVRGADRGLGIGPATAPGA